MDLKDIITKRDYKKREKITDRTFDFTKEKLQYQIVYQGNGIQPTKYFDKSTEGLCLFFRPNGKKTFYAVKSVEMYNKRKSILEKNAKYKKIFTMEDRPDRDYQAAKNELSKVLTLITQPKNKTEQKTFEVLAKEFLKSGLIGYRLADKSEKYEYKKSTVNKYQKLINTYILLKGSSEIRDRMCVLFEYNERISNKPFKDYTVNEIGKWHLECVQTRMKEYKITANDVIKIISIIFSWAILNNKISRDNPVYQITKFRENKIKIKLSDIDRKKVLDYCESKAFDYEPHFLTYIGLLMYLGKRLIELLGCRWDEPTTEKEKLECSGWLAPHWEREKYLYLRDTKNRRPEKVYLDEASIKLLRRLSRARFTEVNHWCVKSKFIFPQSKDITKSATHSTFRKRLEILNEKLELDIKFLFKYARKTFGSYIAAKFGIERASRKLNHSSTKVTADHYVVPEDREMEIENIYEDNLENIKRLQKIE